jgi:hypothetical protein
MIKKLFKTIIKIVFYPLWKPIHWMFIEDVYYIKEDKKTVDISCLMRSNGGKEFESVSTFEACQAKRFWVSPNLLSKNGIEEGYSSYYYDYKFNTISIAEKAIEKHKILKAGKKTIKHKI